MIKTTMTRQLAVTGMMVAFLTGFPCTLLGQSGIELVSVNRRGFTGDGPSQGPAVSEDGRYVAFYSDATDLLALNSRNGRRDVYLRDRVTQATELISVAFDGGEANGTSGQANSASVAISGDGCVVAFSSNASNLVEGDENGLEDVFVRDRCAGYTERISVGSEGEADGMSSNPDISIDGRFVVFQSRASNLAANDTNGSTDIFVRDREMGETTLASVIDQGYSGGNGDSIIPAISGDGRVVAFESVATNLAPGANGQRNVFLRELQTGQTELISVTPEGKAGNGKSYAPDLSFDGSVVAFKSEAWNLVSDDTNGVADTFARDRGTGTTERVSVDGFGNEAESASAHPSISADGRYVSFPSFDDFLVSEDGNHRSDVFVYDRFGTRGNRIARVSVEPIGTAEIGVPEVPPDLSANGRWIAFSTASSAFVPPDGSVVLDNNGALDVFVTCNPLGPPCQCLVSDDCGEGLVCEPSENQCVTPTPTATPTATPTTTPTPTVTLTPTSTAVPCDDDEDCPPGSDCIDGKCEPQACEDDRDCPPASTCQDGQCLPVPCDDDEDCPPASTCEDGQCAPIDCVSDTDCPPGATCVDGECEAQTCEEDRDCPPASKCQDGQCVSVPCDDDGDCPPASTCEDGQCAPIDCVSDRDCPPGATCTDGECVAVLCETDEDCPFPSECEDGQCVPIDCTSNDECPAGSVCDPEEQYCVRSGGGGGGGCNIEIGSQPDGSVPRGVALLIPALLIWLRRRRIS